MRRAWMRTAVYLAVIGGASMTDRALSDYTTCESHLMSRAKLDVKVIGGFLGRRPAEIEEMFVWLDRYCPDNPKENIVSAMRKFQSEKGAR
ncbi:hypothetical protein [Bradyrhizobium sp. JYMT SZCCT0180]|uniref:hypothetical protein n=1 Tax=Bradyrhizobium sp. JYMT SZCCT0180 TaxID=2807666 RepID=UPI001BADC9B4|nr:hypothetical protein [Bradyrhizobium sp. JYMT SZCCT0180]MBR1214901.1 hypothetical protein [Bradyrhizobium sp. JYMT SZCCT0180]